MLQWYTVKLALFYFQTRLDTSHSTFVLMDMLHSYFFPIVQALVAIYLHFTKTAYITRVEKEKLEGKRVIASRHQRKDLDVTSYAWKKEWKDHELF